MMRCTARFAHRFAGNRDGGVAVLFGLMVVALLTTMGVAVDFSRILHTKARLVAAADAASLAAGRALLDGRLSDADIIALAQSYFTENVGATGPDFGTVAIPTVGINRTTGEVRIDVAATVPMTLMQLAGFDQVAVPVASSTKFEEQDVELSLALDVTGSMDAPGKMDALKDATKDLIDIMLPDGGTTNDVRVALAPYSSGVNAGSYVRAATGQSTHTCTFEREGADQTSDAAPAMGNYLKVRGDAGIWSSATCPTATVTPLSDDKAALKSAVDGYRPTGSTAGHLGAQWASYLISPNWSGVFGAASAPAPFYDDKTVKAVVLMSDGLFNTVGGRNYGDNSTQARQSQAMAVAVCDALRAKSVMVFTVGFRLDDIASATNRNAAAATLADCAGSSERYFDARDAAELRAAFQQIANQLNNLRLTN
ncbi:MAG: pilus assembly protein [Hyphomicrobiaceae bacterium]|nr:pilus assembly protein [Hyphomicrobiaceae bacterium]